MIAELKTDFTPFLLDGGNRDDQHPFELSLECFFFLFFFLLTNSKQKEAIIEEVRNLFPVQDCNKMGRRSESLLSLRDRCFHYLTHGLIVSQR